MFELRTDLFADVCPRRRRGNTADMRTSLHKNTRLQRTRYFKGKATKGRGRREEQQETNSSREAGATCMALGLLVGNWDLERNHLKITFVSPDEEVHYP